MGDGTELLVEGQEILDFITKLEGTITTIAEANGIVTGIYKSIGRDAECITPADVTIYYGKALGELGIYVQSLLAHIGKLEGFCRVCQYFMNESFQRVVEMDASIAQQLLIQNLEVLGGKK